MKKLKSKQRGVQFYFCPSPITIDKRSDWGDAADNLQHAPNGAFLKTASSTEISHLVQPNEDKTAPIGWMPSSKPGLYDKLPIWVDEYILQEGDVVDLETADGYITYIAKESAMICYNDLNGEPNQDDKWVQTVANIEKNYEM